MTLNHSFSSGLPFHPDSLCFGWDANTRFLSERRFNHALLRGQGSLISLADQYSDSFTRQSQPTLLHYRDRLLGAALLLTTYNAQFTSLNHNKFTAHCNRFWTLVPYEQLWDGLAIDPARSYSFRYSGLLGSLAFYFKDLQLDGLYPLDCLRKLLSYLWSLLGISLNNSPADRHAFILRNLKLPAESLGQISTAALYLLSNSTEVLENPYRQAMRRWLVGPNDARSLPARFILGEFNDKLLEFLSEYLDLNPEAIVYSQHVITSLLPPAGMPQLYRLFALESLYKAAEVITNLDLAIQSTPLDLMLRGRVYQEVSAQLAESLALASDAWSILSTFNTYDGSLDNHRYYLSETLYWMRAAGLSTLPQLGANRLSAFTTYLDS